MVAQALRDLMPDLRPFHPSHSVEWSGHGAKCMLCGAKTPQQLRAPCRVGLEVLEGIEDSGCPPVKEHMAHWQVSLSAEITAYVDASVVWDGDGAEAVACDAVSLFPPADEAVELELEFLRVEDVVKVGVLDGDEDSGGSDDGD